MLFGGNFCPRGYAAANGQLISIASNSALFSLLGTQFGGDGRTTFGLPDLRGRVPVGVGIAPGISAFRVGQKAGQFENRLNEANLPAHKHGVTVATTVTAKQNAANAGTANTPAGQLIAGGGANSFGSRPPTVEMAANSITATAASTATVSNTGGGTAFTNMQPSIGITYGIATQGIFPSRN
jgi:microcystin-dependent protein